MSTSDVATAIQHFYTGTATQPELELLLRSYEPLFRYYIALLRGNLPQRGTSLLSNDGVRIFAYSFRQGGDMERTLQWVVSQCRRFSGSELRATVVEAFFHAIAAQGRVASYSRYLAENLRELLGNPLEVLIDDLHRIDDETPEQTDSAVECIPAATDVADDAYQHVMSSLTEVERLFHERGIVLTMRERDVIRLLAFRYDVDWVATQLDLSRRRVYAILEQLKEKARLT